MIVEADTSKIQQEIHKTNKSLKDLEKERKSLLEQQAGFKAAHRTESKEYAELSRKITKNTQAIADENANLLSLTKTLGTNAMTMSQLRKEAKLLQKQLDNTSKALEPEAYADYANKLKEINDRMAELRGKASGLKDVFSLNTKGLDFGSIKSFVAGSGIFKIGEMIFENVSEWVGRAVSRVKDLIVDSVAAAREAEGITRAFEKMNRPDLLDNLRKATRGTVTDLELMKAAVQAKDFRLPLDQLGKYLEFAQMKARDTGQSVDYLTNSIVTGLGRKSPQILDNLGISAAQIKEEMAKGGDMAEAVGRIIDQQLDAQGEHYETAAEREEQATTKVTNAQLELGKQMSKTFGIGKTSFSEMQAKAETFILKGLTKLIIYCQDLYNKLASVRVIVEVVKVVFDTLFKVCEVGFLWVIDLVKGVGRVVRDFAGLLESVFTRDWDNIKNAGKRLIDSIAKTYNEFANDGKDVGERWGNNVLDGINAVMGKKKIKAPSTELEGVTVIGHRREKTESGGGGSSNTTGSSGKENENSVVSSFSSQRQQDLDEAKKSYQKDVNELRQALADKRLSQEMYNAIMSQLTAEHAKNLLDIERSYYERSLQLNINDGTRKQQLVGQQLKNVESAEQQSFDSRLKQQEQFNAMLETLSGMGPAPKETKEDRYKEKLSALSSYYQASLEYARKNGQDEAKVTEAYERAKANIKQAYEEEEKVRRQQAREQLSIEQQSEYERQHEMLVEALEKEYITKQEYEEKEKQLKMDSWKEQFDYYNQLFGDAVKALQDAEMANIDAKYDAEIEAARKAGKDTTAIENKKANDKLKVEKKYADVDFAIKAAQIVADTVVGITKLWASPGYPMAIPLTVLLGAIGAANLITANAQRQKVKSMTLNGGGSSGATGARVATGKEEGGYMDVEREQDGKRFHAKYDPKKRGFVDKPTVIVGEGPHPKEWIASNAAVENPTVAPLINVLDQMQRAGTIRSFDLNKYLMREQTKGLANGGSLNGQPLNPPRRTSGDSADVKRLSDILERMEENGLHAIVGIDEWDARQQLKQRSLEFAKKE